MSKEFTHASFFSGVGGIDLGLERAGFRTVSHSEIDPYCNKVLKRHWPNVPNIGDITDVADYERRQAWWRKRATLIEKHKFDPGDRQLPDPIRPNWTQALLWSGGFPCQGLSIAGNRKGLEDLRSNLAYTFIELIGYSRPPWLLIENVPGLLSSNHGQDLGTLLSLLDELGYGLAWRVFDASYFGVPQRRRRVFIVGHLGDRSAASILFESESSTRNPAPPRKKGQNASGIHDAGATSVGSITAALGHHGYTLGQDIYTGSIQISTPSDSPGVRETHGLARRLDSPRYRCCGNGVVSAIPQWVGSRIIHYERNHT